MSVFFHGAWRIAGRGTARAMLGVALLAGAGLVLVGTRMSQWSRPALELSTHRLDLGEGKPGDLMRGAFNIRNTGSRTLEFDIQASCGCTELTPRSGTVLPGERQEIDVAIELPDYSNAERNVRVVVHSNDPKQAVATCLAVAKCPAPFAVRPARVRFGQLLPQHLDSAVESLQIEHRNGVPLKQSERLQVRHESKFLTTAWVQTGDGPSFLRVSLSPDVPQGDFCDTIELQVEGTQHVVRVPVHAQVLEPVSVVPSTVFLRIDPETGEYSPVDLVVLSRDPTTRLGSLRILHGPSDVRIEDIASPDATTRRHLRLIVTGQGRWGPRTVIKLGFEGVERMIPCKLVKVLDR